MKRYPIHPILFGLYPAVALLAHNINEIKISTAYRAILFSLVCAVILFFILRLVLKNWQRAALVTSLLLVLFFSYGHVYNSLEQAPLLGLMLGRHRLLVPLWLAAGALGLWFCLRRVRDLETATILLNMVSIVVLVIPLYQLASFEVRVQTAGQQPKPASTQAVQLKPSAGRPATDVYYIILDGYSRQDVLNREIAFDNSAFLQELSHLGFRVANCSQSNYAQTELSLASSLNFNYLEELGIPVAPGSNHREMIWPLLKWSAARQAFESMGYTTVSFESSHYHVHWEDADVFLSPQTDVFNSLNDFEFMLFDTSAGLILKDASLVLPTALQPDLASRYTQQRSRNLYILDKLPQLPLTIAGPKFVFAHILSPHEPFIFGPEGEEVFFEDTGPVEKYNIGYRGQVEFLNKKVLEMVQGILHNSPTPPIIILQADHGAGRTAPRNRVPIFNAYYLPDGGEGDIYDTISPVNTFRLILNRYFGGAYPLLEDVSYFSSYQDPYRFRIIENDQSTCK